MVFNIRTISSTMILLSLAGTTYAMGPGAYFGVQIGQSNLHNKAQDVQTGTEPPTVLTTPSNTGMGGRLFGGYQFNQYAAWELGFTYFSPSKYEPSINELCSTPEIKEYSFDLMGKGILPLGPLDIYGKGGLAVVYSTQSSSLAPITDDSDPCGSDDNNSNTYFRPAAAVGVSYDLSQSWVADVSYMRIFGGGGMQSADLVSLGVSYHFTDKYCGQFLC